MYKESCLDVSTIFTYDERYYRYACWLARVKDSILVHSGKRFPISTLPNYGSGKGYLTPIIVKKCN